MKPTVGKVLLISASVVVAAAIAAAILLEPPELSRKKRLDERRVQDLSSIDAVIKEYWKRRQKVPASLEDLAAAGLRGSLFDPGSTVRYEYSAVGEESYRICANFALETADDSRNAWAAHGVEWSHPAGRHCFDRSVGTKSRQG